MAATYTSSSLITAVRDYGYLGANNPTDAQILRALNRVQLDYVVPMLVSASSEFFVANSDTTTTSGTAEYAIPSRSVLIKVRDVQMIWNTASNAPYQSLPYMEPERIGYSSFAFAPSGWPGAWTFRADVIQLVPTPNGSYSLRIRYFRRPSQIVSSGYSVPSGLSGGNLTVASTTGMSNGNFDVMYSYPPFAPVLDDIAGTVTNGTTLALTLTADQTTTLNAAITAGCWITAAGDTPAPQMAPEVITLLEYRTAAVVLAELGDPKAAQVFAECERTLERIRTAMQPRESGLGRKVVSTAAIGTVYPYGVFGGWGSGT